MLSQTGQSSQSEFANFPFVIPNTLKFTSTKQGVACRRVPIIIRAEQPQYASNNNKLIRIIFPNKYLIDTRKGYVTFDLSIAVTGGTYKRLNRGVFSVLNRLKVLAGASEIEDLRDYNRIYSALWEMKNSPDVSSGIGQLAGFGTQAERNASGAILESYYCPLMSGVLNTELLPTENIAGGLVLELTLEDATACVETDGTNPIITISKVEFHMERLELDMDYRNFIKNSVATNGMKIGFTTWDRIINALTTGSRSDLNFNIKNSSVYCVLNFLINSAQINDPTVNDRFLNWTPSPGGTQSIIQNSLQINGTTFPDEPVDLLATHRIQPYQTYCRWIMRWSLNNIQPLAPPITWQSFINNRFVFINDLEAYPEEMDLLNSFSTLGNNASFTTKLVFDGTIPSGWQLDSWVEYFTQVTIFPNGITSINK